MEVSEVPAEGTAQAKAGMLDKECSWGKNTLEGKVAETEDGRDTVCWDLFRGISGALWREAYGLYP